DVLDHHHVVVVLLEDRVPDHLRHGEAIPPRQPRQAPLHPLRRLPQALPPHILSQTPQHLADQLLERHLTQRYPRGRHVSLAQRFHARSPHPAILPPRPAPTTHHHPSRAAPHP